MQSSQSQTRTMRYLMQPKQPRTATHFQPHLHSPTFLSLFLQPSQSPSLSSLNSLSCTSNSLSVSSFFASEFSFGAPGARSCAKEAEAKAKTARAAKAKKIFLAMVKTPMFVRGELLTTAEKPPTLSKTRRKRLFATKTSANKNDVFKFAPKNAVADKIPRVVQKQRCLKNTSAFVFAFFKD